MSATRSESFNFPYVTVGRGGCLFRTASVLTRVQVRRIPIPPMMLAVGLLVLAVVFLRLAQDLGKSLRLPWLLLASTSIRGREDAL